MQVRAVFLSFLIFTASSTLAETKYLNSGSTLPTDLPFSEAVRHGDTLYLSGQIGNVPGTLDLAPGGFEGQARQVMNNIQSTLNAHGYNMDALVKCTVMLQDMSDWPAFNKIYATYFKKHYPARSAFGSSGLAVGAAVEVECIADATRKAD